MRVGYTTDNVIYNIRIMYNIISKTFLKREQKSVPTYIHGGV